MNPIRTSILEWESIEESLAIWDYMLNAVASWVTESESIETVHHYFSFWIVLN